MIANFQWTVSKPYIHICFTHRVVEGIGEGAGWEFVFEIRMGEGVRMKYGGGRIGERVWRRKGR